jgi:hypothetical protein
MAAGLLLFFIILVHTFYRFIQSKLERATLQEKEAIFAEIKPHITNLMTDVFGNYVIQVRVFM